MTKMRKFSPFFSISPSPRDAQTDIFHNVNCRYNEISTLFYSFQPMICKSVGSLESLKSWKRKLVIDYNKSEQSWIFEIVTFVEGRFMGNKYVLAMYDVRGKQNYIFRNNHIKEIAGASAIIRDIFKDYLKESVSEE